MKNILIVWDGNYPWDIRVDKECGSLLDFGYSVHIVSRNTTQQERNEQFKGATIHRLPRFPTFSPAINRFMSFPFFLNPLWLWNIYRVAKNSQCDIVIVRDLPLAISGIIISKLLRIPMILDMAECYPELLRTSNENNGFSFINLLVRNPRFAEYVERYSVKRADHIFVMVEEARQYLKAKRLNTDKTTIVSNTPVQGNYNTGNAIRENENEVQIIYVGLISPFRGLQHVISAIETLIPDYPCLRLKIVGSGAYLADLKKLVHEKKLGRHIDFLGWVNNANVPQLINESDIGIVPHKKCAHSDTTVPNKLFDYMAAGRPVIVSNARPLERIVATENCGLTYQDGNIDFLADAIQALMDKKVRKKLGQNGQRAVKNQYNWNVDGARLTGAINRIISTHHKKNNVR